MAELFEDKSLGFGNEGDLTVEPSSGGIGVSDADFWKAVDQGQDSGLGIAAPRQNTRDLARAEFDKMGGLEKTGMALREFGAGVMGKPSPLQQMVEEKRKDKLLQMEELKGSVTALEHGVTMRAGMSPEDAAKFDEAYGNKLDQIQPGLKDTYLALAKKPDMLTQFDSYRQYLPEPIQVMMKSQPKEFLKFAGTTDGMKMLVGAKDQADLKIATKKVQTAMLGLDQYLPAEKLKAIKADGVITASELLDAQPYLPPEAQLSDAQLEAVKRNDKVFWQGLGVLHGDKEQEVLAKRAEGVDKNKAPTTRQIHEGDKIIDQEWRDGKWVEVGRGNKFKAEGAGGNIAKDIRETELKISDDWRQDTRKFAERKPLFESSTAYMAERDKNKTSAGDAALAFAYAKSRDPNDRLAVSETRDLVKLGNIFERIGVNIAGVLDKGETIPDRVAEDMYKEIRRNFSEQNRAQIKLEKQYRDKIKAYGGDPTRVLGEGLSLPEKDLRPKAPAQKLAVGSTIERGGKKWKVVGHDKDGEPLVEEAK